MNADTQVAGGRIGVKERRALGLCLSCGEPSEGRIYCTSCGRREKLRKRRSRAQTSGTRLIRPDTVTDESFETIIEKARDVSKRLGRRKDDDLNSDDLALSFDDPEHRRVYETLRPAAARRNKQQQHCEAMEYLDPEGVRVRRSPEDFDSNNIFHSGN